MCDFRASPENMELEIRLGYMHNGQFCPGVSRDVFHQLESDMSSVHNIVPDKDWVELIDYHYTTATGNNIRTRVEFDAERMEVSTTHITKNVIRTMMITASDNNEDGVCRVALSLEDEMKESPVSICIPTHVRVKQRKCFHDVRNGRCVWRYELSKTWSAGSRCAVEKLQHESEPVYEVECELVDDEGAYLATRSDGHVAKSITQKVCMFLGERDIADIKIHESRQTSKKKRASNGRS